MGTGVDAPENLESSDAPELSGFAEVARLPAVKDEVPFSPSLLLA